MYNPRRTHFTRQHAKNNRYPAESQAEESGHSNLATPGPETGPPHRAKLVCLISSYEARLRPDAFHKALDYEFSQNRQGRPGAAGLGARPPRAVSGDGGGVRSALPGANAHTRSPLPVPLTAAASLGGRQRPHRPCQRRSGVPGPGLRRVLGRWRPASAVAELRIVGRTV